MHGTYPTNKTFIKTFVESIRCVWNTSYKTFIRTFIRTIRCISWWNISYLVCKTFIKTSNLCTISKGDLVCVVVNKLVNIISLKSAKWITVAKTMGQEQLAIHTNQVSASYNGVNMNNRPNLSAVILHFRLNYPHPCLTTWGITNDNEPLNQGTGVWDVMGGKG